MSHRWLAFVCGALCLSPAMQQLSAQQLEPDSPEEGIVATSADEAVPDESGGELVPILQLDETMTSESDLIHERVSEEVETEIAFGDWLGYNSADNDMTWLTGHGDDLGIFSIESFPTLDIGEESALMLGTGIHFVNGPIATDLPPRLFDLHLAYHTRRLHTQNFIYDMKLGVGVFTDFEGSSRKGVRFPGHVVSYYQWHPWLVSVFGLEAFDRDDISVLPVAGLVWRPRRDLVYELVFPRPKVQVKLDSNYAMYLSGELGGDTWAIERSNAVSDNATYRDLRVVLGVMDFDDGDSALEIGWAFDRQLEYRSGQGNYQPEDAFLVRFRAHY